MHSMGDSVNNTATILFDVLKRNFSVMLNRVVWHLFEP